MRRLVNLVLALIFVGLGATVLIYQFVFAKSWKVHVVLVAGLLISTGATWLYDLATATSAQKE
jgi:hypothetical protein